MSTGDPLLDHRALQRLYALVRAQLERPCRAGRGYAELECMTHRSDWPICSPGGPERCAWANEARGLIMGEGVR